MKKSHRNTIMPTNIVAAGRLPYLIRANRISRLGVWLTSRSSLSCSDTLVSVGPDDAIERALNLAEWFGSSNTHLLRKRPVNTMGRTAGSGTILFIRPSRDGRYLPVADGQRHSQNAPTAPSLAARWRG